MKIVAISVFLLISTVSVMSYALRGQRVYKSLLTILTKQPTERLLRNNCNKYCLSRGFHNSAKSLFAKKQEEDNESDWVTIRLGDDEKLNEVEMDRRITDAKSGILFSDLEDDEDMSELRGIFGVKKAGSKVNSRSKPKPKKPYEQLPPTFNSLKSPTADKYAHLKANKLVVQEEEDIHKQIRTFLQLNPYVCSGCGTSFQTKTEDAPGFLPKEKFAIHREHADFLKKTQQAIDILDMAEMNITSEHAIRLLREAGIEDDVMKSVQEFARDLTKQQLQSHGGGMDIIEEKPEGAVESLEAQSLAIKQQQEQQVQEGGGEEQHQHTKNKHDHTTICQRCYRLQQYGQIENSLRPGWSQNELLTPAYFEKLLTSIKTTPAVVLCLVDIFDLQGSILTNLKQIVGKNPLILAVNKVDLLPKDISQVRIKNWIYQEVKRLCDFQSPREVKTLAYHDRKYAHDNATTLFGLPLHGEEFDGGYGARKAFSRNKKQLKEGEGKDGNGDEGGEETTLAQANIHLVSCHNGLNVDKLMEHVFKLARENERKIYVMGAANVGKSSLINRFTNPETYAAMMKKRKPLFFNQKKNSIPLVTVSNLPGTTLDFVKIKLPNDMLLIDTPGLINPGHLASKLTFQELKQIIPMKPVNAVTLRVEAGKCVLLGGIVSIDFVEGKPFFFTFFVSNEVKIHPTDIIKRDHFINTHIGKLIFPPHSIERLEALGPYKEVMLELEGKGWEEAATDIVLPGFGWVAITGCGPLKINVRAPQDMDITTRQALLPFETRSTGVKFTGSKLSKTNTKSGKTSKGYGWRV